MKEEMDAEFFFGNDEECPCCRWMEEEFGMVDEEPLVLLQQRGFNPADPATLNDDDLPAALALLIEKLASIRVFLECTDHLSDRELYEKLFHETLHEAIFCSPDNEAGASHIDYSGSCGEDLDRYLRYYADETSRELWAKDFPEDPMPPHEEPPFSRDATLPRPEWGAASDEVEM